MTKPSSSRKQNKEYEHSKYSIMRKKLKLMDRPSAAHHETDIRKRNDADKCTKEESRNEEIKEEEQDHIVKEVKSKIFFQRASPMKLVRLYKSLSADQHTLIRNEDYGGLLDIRCSKLQPELCHFLMESFDASSCELVFPGRGSIPVNEGSVHEVLGVPHGDLDVIYGLEPAAITFMEKQLGKVGSKQPTVASIEQRLVLMKKADRKFLRHFIGYAMSSILAPTTAVRISPRLYPSLVNIKDAKRLNMCKFVVMIICKALRPTAGKRNVMPCMLYLMVKCLDSLVLQGMDINEEGTRVSVWTNAMIKKAMDQDRGSDGRFGAAPLKPEFRNIQATSGPAETATVSSKEHREQSNTSLHEAESDTCFSVHCDSEKVEVEGGQSIFFSEPEKIDRFIEVHAPKGLTPGDKARYRESIEYACHSFEAGLQMMMRTIPYRPENRGTSAGQSQARGTSQRDNVNDGSEIPQGSDKGFKTEELESEDGGLVRRNRSAKKEAKATDTMQDDNNSVAEGKAPEVSKGIPNCKQSEDTAILALPCQDEIASAPMLRTSVIRDSSAQHGDAPTKHNESSLLANTSPATTILDNTSNIQHPVPASDEGASTRSKVEAIPEKINKPDSTVPAKGSSASAAQDKASEDVVPTKKLKFTHLDARKTNHIDSLMRHMLSKQKNQEGNVTTEGTEKENVPPSSSKLVGIGATSTKSDDSAGANSRGGSSSLGGVDSNDEEDNSSNSEEKRKEFLAYVASSPPGRIKFDIPLFEEKVFLDMETARPAKGTFQSLLKGLKPVNMEEAAVGLPSLLDDSTRRRAEAVLSEMEQKLINPKRKPVTLAGQRKKRQKKEPTTAAPSPSRYRTRSAVRLEAANSPNKVDITGDDAPRTTPVRDPNKDPELQAHVTGPASTPVQENSGPKTLTPTVPISAAQNSMNRQLIFESTRSEKAKEAAMRAPDAPSFELLIDTPPECKKKKVAFVVQEGCSNADADPAAGSKVPVIHEYDNREPRKGKQVKSAFTKPECEQSYTVSKSIDNLYWMVCEHGWKRHPRDPANGKTALDIDKFFVDFGLLGDSVAPRCLLANSVAECAINLIRSENPNPKKIIMPLRVSRYLIDCRLDLKDVTRCFHNTTTKLDEKDEICFPTLEKFPGQENTEPAGHYWLVVLNIKEERFEILDSLAKNGEPLMMEPCHYMIASIKTMWAREYNTSKVQIAMWHIELIESPAQDNLYDCGFFMLKNLEEKNGQNVAPFTRKDIPNIRKLYTNKWLRANKTNEWKNHL